MATFRSFKKVQEALLNRTTNCVAITQSYLDEIEKNKHLNAFVEVFDQEALQEANRIDKKIKAGSAGKLAGMVIGLKDNLCYKGHKVTASSKILKGFESIYSATVVNRLLEEEFAKRPHTRHLAIYAKKHSLNTDAWFWGIDWGLMDGTNIKIPEPWRMKLRVILIIFFTFAVITPPHIFFYNSPFNFRF